MAYLALFLLGSPHIESEGAPLHISRRKAMALLAYLAMGGPDRVHERDALATLLWPEQDQNRARHGLRSTLSSLKAALGEGYLIVNRETVRLFTSGGHSSVPTGVGRGLWLDVDVFCDRLDVWIAHAHPVGEMCPVCIASLEEAVALYGDDFMAGFTLPDSPAFDEWQFFERQDLRSRLTRALEWLAYGYGVQGEYERALSFARRWVALDPLHEPAHRLLMDLYARAGQRAAALRQYVECERILQEELNAPPEEETQQLYWAIRARRELPKPVKDITSSVLPPDSEGPPGERARGRHNLPAELTPFVGRETQLAEVCAMLARPEVRLLTLTGAGGTGKTRLALQVATKLLEAFADGVFFVGLAPIRDPTLIVPAIAAALGVRESGESSLLESLQYYLRDRELLLVVDNLEHLLEGAPALTGLLAAAERLKILVTSRASARLYSEHEYVVPPMAVPQPRSLPLLERLAQSEAVQLFVQRAEQVQPGFMLTQESAPAVAEICARLDGLPLAIELAAVRAKLFSPQAILPHLDDRLGFLTTGPRDLPARQRTLRATIEWSYGLLNASEQVILCSLAVFAGGFTLTAAQAIAAGTQPFVLGTLHAFVDQHLLQCAAVDDEPRFTMLETVREYAVERLEDSGEINDVHQRHAAFYLALAEESEARLDGPERISHIERLETEHDNMRVALAWSLENAPGLGLRLSGALGQFWVECLYLSEGRNWLSAFLATETAFSPEPDPLRAKVLDRAGRLANAQGDKAAARALHGESMPLWRAIGDCRGLAHALWAQAEALDQSDLTGRHSLLRESMDLSRRVDDERALSYALSSLVGLFLDEGDVERAQATIQELLGLGESAVVARTGAHFWQGRVAFDMGNYAAAEVYSEKAFRLCQQYRYDRWTWLMLWLLGRGLYAQGKYDQARAVLEHELELVRRAGIKTSATDALSYLGFILLHLDQPQAAHECFVESLALDRDLGRKRHTTWSLVGLAGALIAQGKGQEERAGWLLGATDPFWEMIPGDEQWRHVQERDRQFVVSAVRAQLDEETFDRVWAKGQALAIEDWEQAVVYALDEGI